MSQCKILIKKHLANIISISTAANSEREHPSPRAPEVQGEGRWGTNEPLGQTNKGLAVATQHHQLRIPHKGHPNGYK